MKEIELINNDSLEEVNFERSDFYSSGKSLTMLLKDYYNTDLIENQDEILKKIVETHRISHKAFHEMIRVFKRRLLNWGNKYWVHPLKKEILIKKIELGKEKYPDANFRFLRFRFNGRNNAKFSYKFVGEFDFETGLSCFIEPLLEYIIKTYDKIYVVKGRNDLSNVRNAPIIINGKTYDGKYNVAMLKCELKQSTGLSEKESFHYYDVVHDPGGNR